MGLVDATATRLRLIVVLLSRRGKKLHILGGLDVIVGSLLDHDAMEGCFARCNA